MNLGTMNELVIEIKDGITAEQTNEILPQEWSLETPAPNSQVLVARTERELSPAEIWELCYQLQESPMVEIVEPAVQSSGLDPLADELTPYEQPKSSFDEKHLPETDHDTHWSVKMVRIPEAWAHAKSKGRPAFGDDIVVGHPDTGYTNHAQIWSSRLLHGYGYNFYDRKQDALDPLEPPHPGHGTSTSSVIFSEGKNSKDEVWGTAPSARLVPLRVMKSVVVFDFQYVTQAIDYAAGSNHHVISMSLGGIVSARALRRAIRRATSKGLIVMAAAGNRYPFVVSPAKLPEVIAVGACNARAFSEPSKGMWSGSATGPKIDVSAPGESVWRARRDLDTKKDEVERGSGTSYAVATLAGIAAVWLAYHDRDKLIATYGAANIQELFRYQLKNHGVNTPTGWKTDWWGAGVVDAEALLKAPLPSPSHVFATKAGPPNLTFERYFEYFPILRGQEAELLRALREAFGISAETDESALIGKCNGEIEFALTTDTHLREEITSSALNPDAKPKSRFQPSPTFAQISGN